MLSSSKRWAGPVALHRNSKGRRLRVPGQMREAVAWPEVLGNRRICQTVKLRARQQLKWEGQPPPQFGNAGLAEGKLGPNPLGFPELGNHPSVSLQSPFNTVHSQILSIVPDCSPTILYWHSPWPAPSLSVCNSEHRDSSGRPRPIQDTNNLRTGAL